MIKSHHLNGITDFSAHDAIGDSIATIKLAELIDKKNPELWSASLLTTSREDADNIIKNNKIFCITETYFW